MEEQRKKTWKSTNNKKNIYMVYGSRPTDMTWNSICTQCFVLLSNVVLLSMQFSGAFFTHKKTHTNKKMYKINMKYDMVIVNEMKKKTTKFEIQNYRVECKSKFDRISSIFHSTGPENQLPNRNKTKDRFESLLLFSSVQNVDCRLYIIKLIWSICALLLMQ